MSLVYPAALAAVLAGIGVYRVLARRIAVLVLIGVELIFNAANLLLVTAGSRSGVPFAAAPCSPSSSSPSQRPRWSSPSRSSS